MTARETMELKAVDGLRMMRVRGCYDYLLGTVHAQITEKEDQSSFNHSIAESTDIHNDSAYYTSYTCATD